MGGGGGGERLSSRSNLEAPVKTSPASQPIPKYSVQVALLASLAQLLPPRSPTVNNPVPDSRAAAPQLRLLASRLRPLQLLLAACVCLPPDCVRFSCCSPLASASSLRISRCSRAQLHHFNCCSPFVSASSCAPRLGPPQLLLHARRLRPLQLLLRIASASATAPRLGPLRLLLPDCMHPLAAPASWIPARTFFGEFEVQ